MGVAFDRVVFIGAAASAERTLRRLLLRGVRPVSVLGLAPERASTVSGYVNLCAVAAEYGLPSMEFSHVSDPRVVEHVASFDPSAMFIVGLSQLAPPQLLATSRVAIGFHPTLLPQGRGRAPLAWLVMGAAPPAATFFEMRQGTDDGPILVQVPFDVADGDDAEAVHASMLVAIDQAVDALVMAVREGRAVGTEQDEAAATYLGRRSVADGLINWQRPAAEIVRLVRASAPPNPGARFRQEDGRSVIVRFAQEADGDLLMWRGVPGRVLRTLPGERFLVQCGVGAVVVWGLQVSQSSETVELHVGEMLRFDVEKEVIRLRERIARLEQLLVAE